MQEFDYVENLNSVINNIVVSIKSGQDEIFSISENIRTEVETMKMELENLKVRVSNTIFEVEYLEKEEKKTKEKLSLVSKNFQNKSEEDIRKAYEDANNIQVQLVLKREEEKNLIKSRNDLEIRLKKNYEIVEKAEKYMSKMKSVMDFLIGDLKNVSKKINSLEDKTQVGMKIIIAQEEERRRIVRDIHDGPAQSIASLVIKSEIIGRIVDKDIIQAKNEISSMKNVLRDILKDVRRIMYDLSPTSLDDLGLIPTIKRLISDIECEKGINVDLIILNEKKVLNPLVRLTTFRIIQESLNNTCKHSNARNIAIRMDINEKKVCGIVQDNGRGFDIDSNKKSNGSLGIEFMKERASLLEGSLSIESAKGKGTKVIFAFPNKEVKYE